MDYKKLIPQTLGGSSNNIYNYLLHNRDKHRFELNRAPLWNYIKKTKPRRIVEIGFGTGHNSVETVKLSPNSKLWIFDIFDPNYISTIWMKGEAYENYCRLLKHQNVTFVVGDTRETLPKHTSSLPKMDLIFIDGNHSYEACKSDWECSKSLMHKESSVWFHDYDKEGVSKVVDEIGGYTVEVIEPEKGPLYAKVSKT